MWRIWGQKGREFVFATKNFVFGYFCDIIYGMKRNTLFLLLAVLAVAGCRQGYRYDDGIQYVSGDEPVVEQYCGNPGCSRCAASGAVANCGAGQQVIRYSTPNGNDLRVETSKHVLQIDGQPDKKYDYYIWAGDKTYADDPDVVIDGVSSVMVEQ